MEVRAESEVWGREQRVYGGRCQGGAGSRVIKAQ